jgi:hypothetical protein
LTCPFINELQALLVHEMNIGTQLHLIASK